MRKEDFFQHERAAGGLLAKLGVDADMPLPAEILEAPLIHAPLDTLERLHRRVEHDLHDIENWSTASDLYILFRTLTSLL
ncbi:hypothetical protein G5V57_26245 [Nordella sp. HKS 07]|uniref:hypothetical protein n=1 Tax=Nordella sp. HKS 07 TaxID=2712222 RepID=UPI0013E10839|nr:hypothetical protein [Nordella sp. HKS 07]QIG50923.1 hypothetical protein G5V57_26245 [Nordella sp. HKS 07]